MNNKNRPVITDNDTNLSEIKILLRELIGDEITFNQFTGIMDKDNTLRFYVRNSLLHRRKNFFKGEKRKRRSAKEIHMPLEEFISFLETLAYDNQIKFDLEKFKKSIIYCIDIGHIVGK